MCFFKKKRGSILDDSSHKVGSSVSNDIDPSIICIYAKSLQRISELPTMSESIARYHLVLEFSAPEDSDVMTTVLYLNKCKIAYIGYNDYGNGQYVIRRLWVIPELRHLGLGSELLRFVAELAKNKNGTMIFAQAGNFHGPSCSESHEMINAYFDIPANKITETTPSNRMSFYLKNGFISSETDDPDNPWFIKKLA